MSASPIQIFEYLLALINLTVPLVRDIQDYNDKFWWQVNLSRGERCLLFGSTNNAVAWLEVYKQDLRQAPLIPRELEEWVLDKTTDPDKSPAYYKTRSLLSKQEEDEYNSLLSLVEEIKGGQAVLNENENCDITKEPEAYADRQEELHKAEERLKNRQY